MRNIDGAGFSVVRINSQLKSLSSERNPHANSLATPMISFPASSRSPTRSAINGARSYFAGFRRLCVIISFTKVLIHRSCELRMSMAAVGRWLSLSLPPSPDGCLGRRRRLNSISQSPPQNQLSRSQSAVGRFCKSGVVNPVQFTPPPAPVSCRS